MKQLIFYFSILLTLLTTSCSNEDITLSAENNDGKSKITFAVSIPQFAVSSRAFNANNDVSNVTKLDVLVFDDNGIYIAKPIVTLEKTDGKSTGYYSMSLEPTTDIRHLHFIANYTDEIAVPTNDVINENMLLSSLKVNNGKDAYWQRITLNGVSEPVEENKDELTDGIPTVHLIRNFAAIQLYEAIDLETKNTGENTAFIQGYALYYEPLQGAVAPILRNAALGGFAEYTTNIGYDALVGDQGYIGFEPSEVNLDSNAPTIFDKNEKYTYERSQGQNGSHTANPTCIIMQGKYDNNTYYYKIDIAENYENLYLLRNFRYIITINRACAGYDSVDNAIKGSSFNQLVDVGIKIEEITDGETTLTVSPTDITLINGVDQELEVKFNCTSTKTPTPTVKLQGPYDAKPTTNFIKNITSGSDGLTINTDENGKKVLSENSGTIKVAIDELTREEIGDRQVQIFEIATSDGLSRKVQITLIDKFSFNPTFSGPNSSGLYEYTFHIPTSLPESTFPLEIYLTEPTCSFTPASGENLSVDWIEPTSTLQGTWRYKKVLTWNEYSQNSTGVYTCYFKANEEITETKTMTVSNRYAYDGSATLQEATKITLDGTTLQNGTLTWYVGDEITDQTITVTLNNNVGYTLSELENFNVTNTNGTLTIIPKNDLITSLEENLEISANDGTATATVKLQIIKIDLSVSQPSLNPTTVALGSGEDVTLTFNMNKVATLTIDAQRLTGASSSTGDVISNPDGTISYTPDDSGTQTITFKTADAVRGGTVTISHEEITPIELPYGRKWNNINVNNGNSNYVGEYKIKVGTTEIGSCRYEYSGGFYGWGSYSRLADISIYDTYTGELQNDTNITITNGTYTISTTIGNLISGSNLSFSN